MSLNSHAVVYKIIRFQRIYQKPLYTVETFQAIATYKGVIHYISNSFKKNQVRARFLKCNLRPDLLGNSTFVEEKNSK